MSTQLSTGSDGDLPVHLVSVGIAAPLRRAFDYEFAEPLATALIPGVRVRVPFGRRDAIGIVLTPPRSVPVRAYAYRAVREVLDEEPLLDAPLLRLCRWASDYYHHPIGEVLATAIPSSLRTGAPARLRGEPQIRITPAGVLALPALPARSKALRALLEALARHPLSRSEVATGASAAAAIRRALAQGWVDAFEAPRPRVERDGPEVASGPVPTEEQEAALAQLRTLSQGYSATLLEGVTGSGKTEVYLQRTADVLARSAQVLVLTPEIGLTPQLLARYASRFGNRVATYHSGLSESERGRAWLRVRSGEVDVLVGTRSAVFAPFPNLGLIVIDEEHDVSFKQQEGLRYSARDVALVRAHALAIPVVLGTATPALETLHNAATARYGHVQLTRRAQGTGAPRIRLVDLRGQILESGMGPTVLEAVERHLAGAGQALLFLNRRGYAPALLCHTCGWTAPCPNCDARLVLHRRAGQLRCHHCGTQAPVPRRCPDCGGSELIPLGQGTERIEEALRLRFPGKRIERFDSDRLGKSGESELLHRAAHAGEIDILVGTQVLAKGHDFPGLTFAGIIDADSALYGSDFRALERMGQLLTQVAGRVGRAGQFGEVLLQTHHPEHPLLLQLVNRGYRAFCAELLAERQANGLPPFAHLALLRAESRHEAHPMEFLRRSRDGLPDAIDVEWLGPAPASMGRRAGHHRAQLLLRSTSRPALHGMLAAWIERVEASPPPADLRWSVDVDPADLF